MTRRRPIDARRWRRIEAVLDPLLDLQPCERPGRLDELCRGDQELRAAVAALLAADERPDGGPLDRGADGWAGALLDDGPPEDDPSEVGRTLGPYRLLRQIGSGGMGVVYEAEDGRLGRRVAVKLLPPGWGGDADAKRRFLREARAASALDHPNLATVYDIGESDGRLYLVMGYYEGETLRETLRRGALPVATARQLAIQLCRGLARAHEAGIAHRDVKPANLVVTRRGEVKILDFGLAKLAGDVSLTAPGERWGTPAYMAPEQLRGEPTDARSDVWAVGVVLYEMIAGRRPFAGDGVQALVAAIQGREPVPLDRLCPQVPSALARTVARALAKETGERQASAGELLAELESGAVPATRRGRRRRRTLAGVAAAVAAVATGAGGLALRGCAVPATRVAVLAPAVAGAERPEVAAAAGEIVDAAVAALASLEGIAALDPPSPGEAGGAEAERQRATEADELLRIALDCRRPSCGVTLRRLAVPGRAVLATAGPFEVETEVDKSQALADAVRVHLRRLYPERQLRPEAPGDRVRPEDYAAYVELARRSDRGERLGEAALDRLDGILRRSPDLLGAYLLAAGIARVAADLDRAMDYAERAHRLAPYDPRPLLQRCRVEVAAGRLEAAGSTLDQLAGLAPADARVETARAELLEARGDLAAARRLRLEVVRRRPSWPQVLGLASLEVRLGDGPSARRRLAELHAAQPENQYVVGSLAGLEAQYGSLEEAAGLYRELVAGHPSRPYLTNLGFVSYLLGDLPAATAADRRALELEPEHLLTRFNLAAALAAGGDADEAGAIFAALETRLAAAPEDTDLRARMLHAQCLARLGRRQEAVQLAEEVLAEAPEDLQVLHQAAQLHALLGQRLSALYYAERCLRKGLRWEWFTIPEFAALADDPELRALLARYRAAV